MSKQFTFLDLASVLRVEGGVSSGLPEAVARYGEFARPNFGGAA